MAKEKTKGISVDFSNTDENGSRLPAGDYVVRVEKVEVRDGSSGFKYLAWTLAVISGEYKGKKIYHNTSLKPEALFNLRNLLMSIGISVPKGKLTLNLKEYVGKVLGVYVEDGEYTSDGKKKKKTEVIEMYPVEKQGKKWVKAIDDEDEDDDDEDEDDDDDDEDEDEDDDEDEDEDDDEDLEEELDDLLDDDDDEDDDEDEDEGEEDEEEEEPAPKKSKSKGKAKEEPKAKAKGKDAKGKKKVKL